LPLAIYLTLPKRFLLFSVCGVFSSNQNVYIRKTLVRCYPYWTWCCWFGVGNLADIHSTRFSPWALVQYFLVPAALVTAGFGMSRFSQKLVQRIAYKMNKVASIALFFCYFFSDSLYTAGSALSPLLV